MSCPCFNNEQGNPPANNSTIDHAECAGITLDLLQMFLRPIDCYIKNGLGQNIGISLSELQNSKSYLELYIAAKKADPETCQYKEELPQTQSLVNKIISVGICL